jgi:hypothetical protein
MNNIIKSLIFFLFFTSLSKADDCAGEQGRYGNGLSWSNHVCKFLISTRVDSPPQKNFVFNDEGLVQVFSDFAKTDAQKTNVGYRVYYIFPLQTKKQLTSKSSEQLDLTHTSGARFKFNKFGEISSPDLKLKYDSKIDPENKGGLEIESFPKGVVFDLGYRKNNSPKENPEGKIIVTDKNLKKCIIANSDFHIVTKYDSKPRYKTNEAIHTFLSNKCPNLDISDFLKPLKKDIEVVTRPSKLGTSPKKEEDISTNETPRSISKEAMDELDSVIKKIEKSGIQK